jgi:hypothetical protein
LRSAKKKAEWQTSLEVSVKPSLFRLKMSVAQGKFAIQQKPLNGKESLTAGVA